MNKVRVGIVGTGGIADEHVKNYMKQPDVEIVAGCDVVPGKAKAFFEKYGLTNVKTDYKNDEEMLADKSLSLDAVSICTFNRLHAKCAIHALDAKVNVLLEKPFTVTLDEAIEVMRAEKKNNRFVSIGFQPRFDENMKMIKKIVQSGTLGKIYYIQTGGGRRRGIPTPFGTSFIEDRTAGLGALADIGCYSLDMVLNALDYPKPLTVTGYTSDFFGKSSDYSGYPIDKREEYAQKFSVDDFAAAFVRLEGDIVLDFRISWAMNMDTSGDTIILGTKGGLRIPSTECWNGTVGGPMKLYFEKDGEQCEETIPIIHSDEDLSFKKIRAFVDACKENTNAPIPTSQIVYNQAIIDGIAKSARIGREISIDIPQID